MQFPVTAAEDIVLASEDLDAFNELRAGMHAEYAASTPTEVFLVEELVQNAWRLRRFRRFEAAAFHSVGNELRADTRHIAFLQRCLTATERAYHRALTALTKLQKERGFVPSKTKSPALPRKQAPPAPEALDWDDEPFDAEAFKAAKARGFVSQKTTGQAPTAHSPHSVSAGRGHTDRFVP